MRSVSLPNPGLPCVPETAEAASLVRIRPRETRVDAIENVWGNRYFIAVFIVIILPFFNNDIEFRFFVSAFIILDFSVLENILNSK